MLNQDTTKAWESLMLSPPIESGPARRDGPSPLILAASYLRDSAI